MPRLIDADKYLEKVCTYKETGCGSCKLQTVCPKDAPTVEAIPIEWLYQKRTLYLENKCYMSLMVINEILNWWEEENESNI